MGANICEGRPNSNPETLGNTAEISLSCFTCPVAADEVSRPSGTPRMNEPLGGMSCKGELTTNDLTPVVMELTLLPKISNILIELL